MQFENLGDAKSGIGKIISVAERQMRSVRHKRNADPLFSWENQDVVTLEFRSVRASNAGLGVIASNLMSDDRLHPTVTTATSGYSAIGSNHRNTTAATDGTVAIGMTGNQADTPVKQSMNTSFNLYTGHFGLKERPFSLLPDPDFLFWGAGHTRAYTMLEYGVLTRAPITLITGEVGAGKTTLMQHLLKNIENELTVGLVSNAHGDRGELLRWVLMALDQQPDTQANYVDLFAAFQKFLIAEYARGNRVVLIFDEAQNMSRESLEELRMFTNINSNKDELLQLVLIGQPELRDMVRRPDMKQFAQRVAASFHLSQMDAETVHQYIHHRLKIAGAKSNLFSQSATQLVYDATGGVPRLVNQLCDLAMVYAYTEGHKTVLRKTVQSVLSDGTFFGYTDKESKEDPQQ